MGGGFMSFEKSNFEKWDPYNWEDGKWNFDVYLFDCFEQFLNKEENHDKVEGGKCLKDGVEFRARDITNNCPEIVCFHTWQAIVYRHQREFNYN